MDLRSHYPLELHAQGDQNAWNPQPQVLSKSPLPAGPKPPKALVIKEKSESPRQDQSQGPQQQPFDRTWGLRCQRIKIAEL
mmetsp:Transcript_9926/g.15534  ORF Transcript_9926/g.15534 Transcript_9926/m.15534 type:complete len:81 (+) Transcript_9926:744-986(+)